jgi:hypothetical protein
MAQKDGFFLVEEVLETMVAGNFEPAEAGARGLPPSVPGGLGAFLISRVKLAQKDQQGGLQMLEEACSQRVRCVPAHLDLANYYLRSRRDREAAERFLYAFRLRREALGKLSEVAEGSLERGQLTAVSRLLKFLFGQGPVAPDTNGRVGREFLAVGDFERAFQFLFLARVEFPRDLSFAVDFGVAALRMGKMHLARKVAGAARRLGGGDQALEKRLALLEQALGAGGRA